MKKNTGFTLVELMITLFIISILLTVGLPSLRSYTQSNQLVAASNELLSALHIARSEAIRLNSRVSICESSNGTSCTSTGNWENGWIVFVDANGDRSGTGSVCALPGTDCLLRVHGEIEDDDLTIAGLMDDTSTAINFFTFNARGVPIDNGTLRSGIFNLCSLDSNGKTIGSRAVVLSLSGRVRISDNTAIIKQCPAS